MRITYASSDARLSRRRARHKRAGRDDGQARSGEADVQDEVAEPQVEYSASGPVHDERQQDDGQYYHDHPEEEHDDSGDGIPRYCSGSSHGRQLPTAVRLIQLIRRVYRGMRTRQADGRRHGLIGLEAA